jgi:hypothetical protein
MAPGHCLHCNSKERGQARLPDLELIEPEFELLAQRLSTEIHAQVRKSQGQEAGLTAAGFGVTNR